MLRLVVLVASLSLGLEGFAIAEDPVIPSDLSDFRDTQSQELQNLRNQFRNQAIEAGNDFDKQRRLLDAYNQKQIQIKAKHNGGDTRTSQIQDIESASKLEVKNTGSNPKDVRADVDLRAKTLEAGNKVVETWTGQGQKVVDYPHKWVNTTTDQTLWKPAPPVGTPERESFENALATDADAFHTPGGKTATGNTGGVVDPRGYYLDNESKFLHGVESGDIKTIAKSVDKAAEAAGIADKDDLFFKQSEILRKYGDPVQAHISRLSDTPEEEAAAVREWVDKATAKMKDAEAKLTSPEGLPADALKANSDVEKMNNDLRSKLEAQGEIASKPSTREVPPQPILGEPTDVSPNARSMEGGTADAPAAEAGAEGAVAAGGSIAGGAVQVLSGTMVGGMAGDAVVNQLGNAADENRDLNAGDVGRGIAEGTGIAGATRGGYDAGKKEGEAYQRGEQDLGTTVVKATGGAVWNTLGKPAWDATTDATNRNLDEANARASQEGREATAAERATARAAGAAEGLGATVGMRSLGDALYNGQHIGERADAASTTEALGQSIEDHLKQSDFNIRRLQGAIVDLSTNGDLNDPAVIAEINQDFQNLQNEHARLRAAADTALRQLGPDEPRTKNANALLASEQDPAQILDYVNQKIAERRAALEGTSTGATVFDGAPAAEAPPMPASPLPAAPILGAGGSNDSDDGQPAGADATASSTYLPATVDAPTGDGGDSAAVPAPAAPEPALIDCKKYCMDNADYAPASYMPCTKERIKVTGTAEQCAELAAHRFDP